MKGHVTLHQMPGIDVAEWSKISAAHEKRSFS